MAGGGWDQGGWNDGGMAGGGKAGGGDGGATPIDQVYIKGLPSPFSEDDLKSIFGAYGSIKWGKVLKGGEGKGDAACLVQMSSVEEATWLVNNLHGNIPQGLDNPIAVTFARPKNGHPSAKGGGGGCGVMAPGCGGKGGKGKGGNDMAMVRYDPYGGKGAAAMPMLPKMHFAAGGDDSNLYVKNLPVAADELYIYKLFAPFGGVQSVGIKTYDWGAIAFVKYGKAEDAQLAISALNNVPLPDGTVISVAVKQANAKKQGGAA